QRDDRDKRGAHVPEKNEAHERDNNAFFDKLLAQCRDGTLDQIAPVIGRHHADAFRQRGFDFLQLLFYPIDDIERILAITHDDDTTDALAPAVEFGQTAPDVTAEMHHRDIFQINRRPVFDFEDNVLDVLDLFDVSAATDVILGRCNLGNLAAHIGIARLDRADDVAQRDVVSDERIWIEIDLVLLHETTNRGDFCDAFHRLERVTKIPILDRAQFGEIVFAGVINKRVFVNPADAGGIRTDHWIDTFR